MTLAAVTRLARTLLYEGYALYPYRGSALKNRKRWALGTLYPPSFCQLECERSSAGVDILVQGEQAQVRVWARFLHPILRRSLQPGADPAADWLEAREAEASWGPLSLAHLRQAQRRPFHLPAEKWASADAGYSQEELDGVLELSMSEVKGAAVRRLRVDVHNITEAKHERASRDEAYMMALSSAHLLLECRDGVFVSQLEPPDELRSATADCQQRGLFPVLIGSQGTSNIALASPVILYDHPQIAAESPGDLFDATEIDEILTLRILTLTDAEKEEAARTDPRIRQLLERTHALDSTRLGALHGASRPGPPPSAALALGFGLGQRVRICPRPGGDVLDLALRGEIATICAIEESLDGAEYYAVNIDADPAVEMGMGDQPGHRFYFRREELEAP